MQYVICGQKVYFRTVAEVAEVVRRYYLDSGSPCGYRFEVNGMSK